MVRTGFLDGDGGAGRTWSSRRLPSAVEGMCRAPAPTSATAPQKQEPAVKSPYFPPLPPLHHSSASRLLFSGVWTVEDGRGRGCRAPARYRARVLNVRWMDARPAAPSPSPPLVAGLNHLAPGGSPPRVCSALQVYTQVPNAS